MASKKQIGLGQVIDTLIKPDSDVEEFDLREDSGAVEESGDNEEIVETFTLAEAMAVDTEIETIREDPILYVKVGSKKFRLEFSNKSFQRPEQVAKFSELFMTDRKDWKNKRVIGPDGVAVEIDSPYYWATLNIISHAVVSPKMRPLEWAVALSKWGVDPSSQVIGKATRFAGLSEESVTKAQEKAKKKLASED